MSTNHSGRVQWKSTFSSAEFRTLVRISEHICNSDRIPTKVVGERNFKVHPPEEGREEKIGANFLRSDSFKSTFPPIGKTLFELDLFFAMIHIMNLQWITFEWNCSDSYCKFAMIHTLSSIYHQFLVWFPFYSLKVDKLRKYQ